MINIPGYEYMNYQERDEVYKVFSESGGVLFRHGFEKLRSRYFVNEFEHDFSQYFKVPYSVATSSGSASLKVALQALGVKRGDEVITQAHTFIATVEAIVEVGATPVIVNIDKTLNMNPNDLENAITPKTKCIIPVHMLGVSCKMDEIMKIANSYPIPVLEDNAQSPGGLYKNQFLGTIGSIGIFSFDGGKMLTTGEGGMVVTRDEKLHNLARSFTDHGHANVNVAEGKPRGQDKCVGLGFNYKMMELQGAVGKVQLSKLQSMIADHYRNKTKLNIYLRKELGDSVELREIPNPDGELGDSLTFFLKNKSQAFKFASKWKFGTKCLPDAVWWHFAPNWKHIHMKTTDLKPSWDLIERSVSIPINGKMTDDQLLNLSKNAKEIMEEL